MRAGWDEASTATVPVIDIDSDSDGSRLLHALEHVGFAYLNARESGGRDRNGEAPPPRPRDGDAVGASLAAASALLGASREFFTHTSDAVKRQLAREQRSGSNAGYVGVRTESLDPRAGRADPKEAFNFVIGRESGAGGGDAHAARRDVSLLLPASLLDAKDAFVAAAVDRLSRLVLCRLGAAMEREYAWPDATRVLLRAHGYVCVGADDDDDDDEEDDEEDGGSERGGDTAARRARCARGRAHRPNATTVRLLRYPRLLQEARAGGTGDVDDADRRGGIGDAPVVVRAGAHSDYGTFTLLFQDGIVGGLQLWLPTTMTATTTSSSSLSSSSLRADDDHHAGATGTWIDVPHVPDAILMNIGDLLSFWSGGRLRSTIHRVVAATRHDDDDGCGGNGACCVAEERYSIAAFVHPDDDTPLEHRPAPPCAARPRPDRRHRPDRQAARTVSQTRVITAGEFLRQRLAATYDDRADTPDA